MKIQTMTGEPGKTTASAARRSHRTSVSLGLTLTTLCLGIAPSTQAATTVLPAQGSASATLCDVVQDGAKTRVAWLTTARVLRPTRTPRYQDVWVGTLTRTGRVTERHRLSRNRLAIPPAKIITWRAGCPALIPGAGGSLEAAWQRARVSYYPGNARVGASGTAQLMHAVQDAGGQWKRAKVWLPTATFRSTSTDTVRWLGAGATGSGVLLVQRRMTSGSNGLKLYSLRRSSNGHWGPYMRDNRTTRDVDARVLAGSGDRLALLVRVGPTTTLQIMDAAKSSWGPPKQLTARADDCRIDGPARLQ